MSTLPTDSAERKEVPLAEGCLFYFPAALAGVARISKKGNDKHNPGEPLHHARGKSTDHADCIIRHLTDLGDRLAAERRSDLNVHAQGILEEASCLAWRALALSQELHERFGAPLAPNAKLPELPELPLAFRETVITIAQSAAEGPRRSEAAVVQCPRKKCGAFFSNIHVVCPRCGVKAPTWPRSSTTASGCASGYVSLSRIVKAAPGGSGNGMGQPVVSRLRYTASAASRRND